MNNVTQGPCEEKFPRTREIVNACWNCKNKASNDPIEHETDDEGHYCLMDGCDIKLFNICRDWEEYA